MSLKIIRHKYIAHIARLKQLQPYELNVIPVMIPRDSTTGSNGYTGSSTNDVTKTSNNDITINN